MGVGAKLWVTVYHDDPESWEETFEVTVTKVNEDGSFEATRYDMEVAP